MADRHVRSAVSYVRNLAVRYGAPGDHELLSAGLFGVARALADHDASRGVSIEGWMRTRARWEMAQELRCRSRRERREDPCDQVDHVGGGLGPSVERLAVHRFVRELGDLSPLGSGESMRQAAVRLGTSATGICRRVGAAADRCLS